MRALVSSASCSFRYARSVSASLASYSSPPLNQLMTDSDEYMPTIIFSQWVCS